MKKILYFLLIITVVACGTTNKTAKTETDSNDIIAVFNDCVLYAGATDYYFTQENGDKIQFRLQNTAGLSPEEISDMRANGGWIDEDVKFSNPMLDPSDKLEGVPGANPAMVGKKFLLVYNERGDLVEVKLKK